MIGVYEIAGNLHSLMATTAHDLDNSLNKRLTCHCCRLWYAADIICVSPESDIIVVKDLRLW